MKLEANEVAGMGSCGVREAITSILTDPVRSQEPLGTCLPTGLLCCMGDSHRAGQGWGATAGIQALPDGQDSGGRAGMLSTPPFLGISFTSYPSDSKFFMNLINRGREEAGDLAQPVRGTRGLSVLDTCRRSTLFPPSTE